MWAPGRKHNSGLGFIKSPSAGKAKDEPAKARAEGIFLKTTTEWKQLKPGFQTSGPSRLSKANIAALRNRNKNDFMDLLWP